MTKKKVKDVIALVFWISLVVLIATSLGRAQSNLPIQIPENLDHESDIVRFIQDLLSDSTKRKDPFSSAAVGSALLSTYSPEDKPRPESGFGRYDVESLILMAIWEESGDAVAMVKAPDELTFIVRIGDEAYDGKIVEINLGARYVKTMNRLVRQAGDLLVNEPKEKWVENYMRFRK